MAANGGKEMAHWRRNQRADTEGNENLNTPNLTTTETIRYTREQCRAGGRISGETRRRNVRDRHAHVRRLHFAKHSNASIARILGYHRSTIGRILKGAIRTVHTLAERTAGTLAYPLRRAVSYLPLTKHCSRNTATKKGRRNRKYTAWDAIWWGKSPVKVKLAALQQFFDRLCEEYHGRTATPEMPNCLSCGADL